MVCERPTPHVSRLAPYSRLRWARSSWVLSRGLTSCNGSAFPCSKVALVLLMACAIHGCEMKTERDVKANKAKVNEMYRWRCP